MAIPGVGFKTVADVLMEISLHLIQGVVYTTASQFAQGGYSDGGYSDGGYSDPIGSLLYVASQSAMYVGANIIVGWGLNTAEIVTVTQVNDDGTVSTSALANAHYPGETILAPTFPTQQTTDPFYTQAEMMSYVAKAQNDLLTDCPVYYELVQQNLTYGQIFQDTPDHCITLARVAASQYYAVVVSITRSDDVALLVTEDPHGLQVGSTVFVQNDAAGFGGVIEVLSIPTPSSITYAQVADDGNAAGGSLRYFSRLYETTQTEITMAKRTWRNDYINVPTAYFEDRAGLYRWGVNGKPSSNFPVELLMAVRDSKVLGLLDGFLVPDTIVHGIKYRAMEYALSKDGVQQDSTRASYCESRYKRVVSATNRYVSLLDMAIKAEG